MTRAAVKKGGGGTLWAMACYPLIRNMAKEKKKECRLPGWKRRALEKEGKKTLADRKLTHGERRRPSSASTTNLKLILFKDGKRRRKGERHGRGDFRPASHIEWRCFDSGNGV